MNLRLKLHQLFHWEYWPMEFIYYPIFPVWLFFSLRAKSFFFFNAANPSITNGGMAMESKKEIYDIIPNLYIPKTILAKRGKSVPLLLEEIVKSGMCFPLILKPDIGMKAFAVDRIENKADLELYINKTSNDFLIQELVPYKKEVGIFYVRYPHEKKGRITGIVSKKFLSVIGDGKHTLVELIKKNPRSHFQLASLSQKFGNRLNTVLEKGEEFVLVPYGSHTRGAKFIDDTHRVTPKLVETINEICIQIHGFYYGRLDILHSSIEELADGKNFSIIEINGAGSEATHIYDPKHSLFFAWKEIIKHWGLLNRISIENYKKGHAYLSFKDGVAMLKANSELEKQLKLV